MKEILAAGGLFVAGTDTGVGKTYVAAQIVRRLREAGVDAVGFKPICCGGREDAEQLWEASGPDAPDLNEINPVWLRTPAAPFVASVIENRLLDLALVRETYARLRRTRQVVVVEGVGGWLAPVLEQMTMEDLAAEWGLPVLLVALNRLGALNHIGLTARAVKSRDLTLLGVVFNRPGERELDPETRDPQAVAISTNPGAAEFLFGINLVANLGPNEMLGPMKLQN